MLEEVAGAKMPRHVAVAGLTRMMIFAFQLASAGTFAAPVSRRRVSPELRWFFGTYPSAVYKPLLSPNFG